MKKKEMGFLSFILLLSFLFYGYSFLQRQKSERVQVKNQEGEILLSVPLSQDGEFLIQGKKGKAYLQIKNLEYRLHQVDCPDKRCEAVGWVSKNAYSPIICLPNGLLVVLENE